MIPPSSYERKWRIKVRGIDGRAHRMQSDGSARWATLLQNTSRKFD